MPPSRQRHRRAATSRSPRPRRRILRLLVFVAFWWVPTAALSQDRPNILLILVDDLGYGDLSSYGAQDMESPHIDAIVDSGMRLDAFYANSPVCSPTRASLLTGRFPDLVGVPGVIRTDPNDSWGHLNPGAVMLSELLQRAGYHTALVGKWHLGLESPNLPNERGFDHFHGFLGDMMDDYGSHLRHGNNYMRLDEQTIDPVGHATDVFTQWAVDFIEDQPAEQPFFLFLSYNAPHTPIQPPQEWLDRVRQREPGISDQRAALVALIEHLDDGIGRVMTALDESGRGEDTLVLFLSDNGGLLSAGASNGPSSGGKTDMLEGGIRVSMAALWPDRIEAGSRSGRTAMTMDLFPTLCDAAGAQCNHEIDGRSLLPTLLGSDPPEEERYLFWVRRGNRGSKGAPYYAARYQDTKILQNRPADAFALYDLAADPQELQDLGSSHPKYEGLARALWAHVRLADEIGWQPGAEAIVQRRISLLEPNGGQAWQPGSQHDIRWTSAEEYPETGLAYSLDGLHWDTIADLLPSSAVGTYGWTVPEILSDSVRIRVRALGGAVSDASDAALRIPEPDPMLLCACALATLSGWRRRRLRAPHFGAARSPQF